MVRIERSWQDKKVVYSLLTNVSKLIGHVVRVLLDNSYEICLRLDGVCLWPSDSSISITFLPRAAALYL